MKALIFDTETTGLIDNHTIKLKSQPELIEFYGGLWDLKKGKLIEETHCLFKPSKPLDEKIIAITGLTDDMLAKHSPFSRRKEEVRSPIEKAPLVIAHNASFDVEMVDLEFERLGEKIEWPRVLCTVEQTVHLKGFRLSLTALHEYLFGEPFKDAHRANVDTAALARCCIELYKRGCL